MPATFLNTAAAYESRRSRGISQAVRIDSPRAWVFLSGQLPLDPEGRLVGPGDPEAQARQVFENVRANLAAAGAGFADVVKMTGFVTDFAHMAAIRRVRADYVDADGPPVSTVVLVPRFADPAMLLEIDVVAALA